MNNLLRKNQSFKIKKFKILLFITSCCTLFTIDAYSSQPEYWSIEVANTVMERYPDPDDYPHSSFSYPQGYLYWGFKKLWEYSGEQKYYDYIMKYADERVSSNGSISGYQSNSLDDMLPGSILAWAYHETGEEKYKRACDRIKGVLEDFPRCSNGGFWHNIYRDYEMWVDGVFMGQMFLTRYGKYVGDTEYCFNEAAKQDSLIEANCRRGDTGLLVHAWYERGHSGDDVPSWANDQTGQAPEVWSEALGWYSCFLTEAIDFWPPDHPKRGQLVTHLENLLVGLKNTFDPDSGMWYQVVDKGDRSDNWCETSGSAMFVYTIQKAIELGIADEATYGPIAEQGYQGMLKNARINNDGLVDLYNSCSGLSVQSSYSRYVDRDCFSKPNGQEVVASFLWATAIMEKPGMTDSKPYAAKPISNRMHVTIRRVGEYPVISIAGYENIHAVSVRILSIDGKEISSYQESFSNGKKREMVIHTAPAYMPAAIYFAKINVNGKQIVRRFSWMR